jgi:hypothetical protein
MNPPEKSSIVSADHTICARRSAATECIIQGELPIALSVHNNQRTSVNCRAQRGHKDGNGPAC